MPKGRKLVYIGLDTATVTGVSLYEPHQNRATLFEVKGDGVSQLEFILKRFKGILRDTQPTFVLEKQHNFLNAVTTRNLLERYGYIKWSLTSFGYPPVEVSPAVARKSLGCKNKEDTFRFFLPSYHGHLPLTSNHTDALAIALHVASDHHLIFGDEELELIVEPSEKLK